VVLDCRAPTSGCVVDDSKGGDSAIPLQPGSKATGQICPPGDQDFYSSRWARAMNLLERERGLSLVGHKGETAGESARSGRRHRGAGCAGQ